MYRLIYGLLLLFIACSENTEPINAIRYFDNPSWFKQELARKKAVNPLVNKHLKVEDDTSSLYLQSVSWEKELEVFSEIDLNKAIYSGKFKVDTLMISSTTGPLEQISYLSLDADLNIRKYIVVKQGAKVNKIQAELEQHSPLMRSKIYWTYLPDSGYSLKGEQEMKSLRRNRFEVIAGFVHKESLDEVNLPQ